MSMLTLDGAGFPPFPIAEVTLPGKDAKTVPANLSNGWGMFLTQMLDVLGLAPTRQSAAMLTTQAASISTSDLTDGTWGAGLYRLTYYARITRAGTISSSLTVTFGWTDATQAVTASGAAITGNTVTTIQTGTILIYSDAASPITYATTYATAGATTMQYRLSVVAERVLN